MGPFVHVEEFGLHSVGNGEPCSCRMGSVPLRKISLESIEEGLGRKWKGGDHLGGGGAVVSVSARDSEALTGRFC